MNNRLKKVTNTLTAALLTLLLSSATSLTPLVRQAGAAVQERTISSGIADASNSRGAKWRKVRMTALATGTATFRLSWSGGSSSDMRFQVLRTTGTVIGGNITASTTSPKSYSTSLTANTNYDVTIWAYSGWTNYIMTVSENVPDSTPPSTPQTFISTGKTSDSVSLSWVASTDNVGVAGYRVYRDTVLVGSPTGTTFTDTGLAENTSYTYVVRAVDASGNLSDAAAPLTVTTDSSVPDTAAPSEPSNLTLASKTHNSVSLTWGASSDDVAVSRYRVYRGEILISSPTLTSFTDTGLSPETAYEYAVEAVDTSGNASTRTAPLAVTTDSAPANNGRPNIVVINLDDMRTDSMIAMPKTVNWMGNGGTFFPNATVSTPSCCPSRASLMSGKYVHNNTQYNQNNVGANLDLMVQRYLHDAGYFTGHSGKFLHWLNINTKAPHWDRWTYWKGGYNNVQMRFDNQTVNSQGYASTIGIDRAIEYTRSWQSQDDDKPFFIQYAPTAPHSPSTPEPQYAQAAVPTLQQKPSHNETDRSDKPRFVSFTNETYAQGSSSRTQMHRVLYTLDDQVDRFMRELEAQGELDNTMVIFTSDNGYFFGEHGRGGKFLPYYESTGVPFYIRWPGRVAAGATDTRFVSHVDITPTILSAAQVSQNLTSLDGRDILSGYARPFAYSEYYYDTANANYITTWVAIRNEQFMYAEYYGQNTDRNGTPTFREYYDMVNDPYEMVNLLKDNTTANDPNVNQLSAQLAAYKNCVGSSCQ